MQELITTRTMAARYGTMRTWISPPELRPDGTLKPHRVMFKPARTRALVAREAFERGQAVREVAMQQAHAAVDAGMLGAEEILDELEDAEIEPAPSEASSALPARPFVDPNRLAAGRTRERWLHEGFYGPGTIVAHANQVPPLQRLPIVGLPRDDAESSFMPRGRINAAPLVIPGRRYAGLAIETPLRRAFETCLWYIYGVTGSTALLVRLPAFLNEEVDGSEANRDLVATAQYDLLFTLADAAWHTPFRDNMFVEGRTRPNMYVDVGDANERRQVLFQPGVRRPTDAVGLGICCMAPRVERGHLHSGVDWGCWAICPVPGPTGVCAVDTRFEDRGATWSYTPQGAAACSINDPLTVLRDSEVVLTGWGMLLYRAVRAPTEEDIPDELRKQVESVFSGAYPFEDEAAFWSRLETGRTSALGRWPADLVYMAYDAVARRGPRDIVLGPEAEARVTEWRNTRIAREFLLAGLTKLRLSSLAGVAGSVAVWFGRNTGVVSAWAVENFRAVRSSGRTEALLAHFKWHRPPLAPGVVTPPPPSASVVTNQPVEVAATSATMANRGSSRSSDESSWWERVRRLEPRPLIELVTLVTALVVSVVCGVSIVWLLLSALTWPMALLLTGVALAGVALCWVCLSPLMIVVGLVLTIFGGLFVCASSRRASRMTHAPSASTHAPARSLLGSARPPPPVPPIPISGRT
jgi:hypothetical protein